MKKVLVLFDLNQRVAPDFDWNEDFKTDAFETESDVCKALRRLGHRPRPLSLYDSLTPLVEAVEKERPDVVFNLSEAFRTERRHEAHLVGLLELLGVPYTGADPTALTLCKDKALAKRLLSFSGIHTPAFLVSPRTRPLKRLKGLTYPAFVKPLGAEGSEGIAKEALVRDEGEGLERVRFIHESLGQEALIEEYVEGRELYAGVLGTDRLQVLPLMELLVEGRALGSEQDAEAPRFFTYKAKWDPAYRKKWGIRSGPPLALGEKLEEEIAETARKVCQALGIRGYGRVDLRLKPDGEIYVIEANPNPGLSQSDEFARAAQRALIPYDTLIARILGFAARNGRAPA